MRDLKDVYLTRVKRGIFIGCITTLVGIPCLGGLFWFIFNVLTPGLENQNLPDSSMTPVVIVSVSILVSMMIPLVVGWFMIKRRARVLDELFLPMGFTGSLYLLNGRQYHRRDGKRDVDIYYYRGPTIEIQISALVDGEFRVLCKDSLPSTLAGKLKTDAIISEDPELLPYAFYPSSSQWLMGFLSKSNVAHAMHELMSSGADWAIFRRVELYSGKLQLHLSKSRTVNTFPLSHSEITNWLRQLNSLADELEAAGLPDIDTIKVNRQVQSRQAMNNILGISIVGIIFGLPLCAIAIMVILILGVEHG